MVFVMWHIRPKHEVVDVSTVYAGAPTWFSIKLHHGGKFTKLPDIKYIGGEVRYVDYVDIDEFSVHELDAIMLDLGYPDPRNSDFADESPVIYYHFRIPNGDFQFGLRALGNDQDVINLSKYIAHNKLIEVYTEHGKTNLLTYFMSPNAKGKVVIEELPENDDQGAEVEGQVHADSSMKNVNHGNGEPIGEFMSLILFGSKNDSFSPEYRRGRVGNSKIGESSCSNRRNLDYIDEVVHISKEKNDDLDGSTNVQEAATCVHIDEMDGVREATNVVQEASTFDEEGYNTPLDDDNAEYEGDGESEEGNQEYEEDDESQESDPNFEEYDESENSDPEYEEDERQIEDEDHMDDIMDVDNNIQDVDVDMGDFTLNVESDVEGGHEPEDMEVINNEEFESLDEGSDQDRERRALIKNLRKEKRCSLGVVHKQSFSVGDKFNSKKELKEAIDLHALESRRNLFFKKNDNVRLRAQCRGVVPVTNKGQVGSQATTSKRKGKELKTQKVTCGWYIHASRSNPESDWFIRTLNQTHTCLQTRKLRACTASLISKKIFDQVEANPDIPLRAIQDHFQKTYQVGVSMDKVFRAKDKARKHITGDYTKQYELLRDYVLELQATNPDTTVKIDVCSEPNPDSPTRQFRRIYVCLGPLKKGFKACLRDLLGFDGAFMKGPFPGQVLSAVGLDPNNGIYPLAYGIVESENTESWKWFLDNLGDDLDLGRNSNFTFISDRQKGLHTAVEQIFPNAEHRYCIRHIHDNVRKRWRQTEYRDHLWRCASATTIPEFEHLMKEFSQYDKEACEWLKQIPPKHWARSHFSGRAVSDVLISNMCEVFNGKIEKGRDKPVIGCLEFIREYLMKRICNVMKEMKKAKGPLTPTATDILTARKTVASQYIARWNGGDKYQVTGALQDQHVVDVRNKTCTCRKWELIGIPCRHAIATLNEISKDPEADLDIYKWVHKVYFLETWKKAYSFKVEPIKGRSMWPKSECPTKLIPPPHRTQVGRPKKKRRQSEGERLSKKQKASQGDGVNAAQEGGSQKPTNDGVQKLSRKHISVTCSKCKNKGHNSRTCKGQGGNQSKK
uniref:SWIM-type domain-containing protein n=2 Tax=Lactuca sativa TaxID=4236 RepID=A0A9R1VDA5_LACSA|nr:hypothetical protein LSAT_V11C500266050 [Lactuca sativa]